MAFMIKASIILAFGITICAVVDLAFAIYKWIRQRKHRRKADARIIAQAKAADVWDKKPIVLGGRALELKAWQDFKIKREPGEPDAHLRRRYSIIEISKRKAEEHGLKIKKVKTDGYNVEVILCDEKPPKEGGRSNE